MHRERNGQEDHHPLIPGILRPGGHDERFLVHTFRLRALSRYPNCPTFDDRPSWLFLMQHYGLPTRLLDWTASPLVALFFAVEERWTGIIPDKPPANVEVVALSPNILNLYEQRQPWVMTQLSQAVYNLSAVGAFERPVDPWGGDPDVTRLFSDPFQGPAFGDLSAGGSDPLGPILAIKPLELDVRVAQQRSRFTIHGRRDSLDMHEIATHLLRYFPVHGPSRPAILLQLQSLGISRMTLFQDLGNLSDDLARFGAMIDK